MHEQGGPSPCAAALPRTHCLTLDLLHLSLVNSSLLRRTWGFEGFGTSLVSSGRPAKPA